MDEASTLLLLQPACEEQIGTYVNERRLQAGARIAIKLGDCISIAGHGCPDVLCILSCEAQCEKDFIRRAWQRKNCLSNLGDGSSNRSELGLGWVLGDITGKFAEKFDGS